MTAAQIETAPLRSTAGGPHASSHHTVAELLARVGLHLGAQRVELHEPVGQVFRLVGWWGGLGFTRTPADDELPASWFPWSLGALRPQHHLFVDNAGPLESTPGGPRLADLGFGSALYLPGIVVDDARTAAVCAYWDRPEVVWDPADEAAVTTMVAQALR